MFFKEWLRDIAPNSNFSKLLEFSETIELERPYFGLQVRAGVDHPRTSDRGGTGVKGSYHGVNEP